MTGLRAWDNRNGYTGVLLHWSADPDAASASESERVRAVPDRDRRMREYELDFSSFAGKSVYCDFDAAVHVDQSIGFVTQNPVWVGMDFGYHHPAAVFAHVGPELWVLGEVMGEDMTLEQFLRRVFLPYRDRLLPGAKLLYAADPAGRQVSDKSDHTSFSILANHGIYPVQKRSEINEGLTIIRQRLALNLLKIHPRCRITLEALKSGYRYPEPTPGRPEALYPLKDGYYEHVADALRYLVVNAISLLIPRPTEPKPPPTWVDRVLRPAEVDDLELLSD